MKLELKYVTGYLPYGLNGICEERILMESGGFIPARCSLSIMNIGDLILERKLHLVKPILRPLSDLIKEIDIDGDKFVPFGRIEQCLTYKDGAVLLDMHGWHKIDLVSSPLEIINQLYAWHFDLHDLIENDLAVEINTLTPAK